MEQQEASSDQSRGFLSIDEILTEIPPVSRHQIILEHMEYPLRCHIERPVCSCNYSCGLDGCDFSDCKKCVFSFASRPQFFVFCNFGHLGRLMKILI